ncbi:MAG: DUF6455 family protein [Roseovarius sp.]
MTKHATIKHHAALMDNMAGALGVDMEQSMLEGRMTMDQLSDAVLGCTGCSNPDSCAHWVSQQTGTASAAPEYCRNGSMLGRLAQGRRA